MKYTGKVVYVGGLPYGIASRYSPSIGLHQQDTGRWSQKEIPDAQLPSKMRALKGCDPGWKVLYYDISNAELRVVTAISGDELFKSAFALGWDLHTTNCCEIFGWDYPPNREKKAIFYGEENKEWREKHQFLDDDDPRRKFAKILNFRTLYGGSPDSAWKIPGANKLGLSREELKQATERWLAAHPKLQEFFNKYGTDAMVKYVVRNAYGRRRVLVSEDDMARYREGINAPIQSHVSDLVNRIVVKTFIRCNECLTFEELRRLLSERESKVRLYGQCHDALYLAFPESEFEKLANIALDIAEEPTTLGPWTFQFPVSYKAESFVRGKQNGE